MRTILATTLLLCLAATSDGKLRENYNVIKIKHWDASITFAVMTDNEVKAFQKAVSTEARLATKALRQAQQAWSELATYQGKTFPRKVTKPPTTSKVGFYSEMEKATAKCSAMKARRDDKADSERQAHINRKKGRSKKVNAREAAQLAATDRFYATARSTYEAALEAFATEQAAHDK
jgi:hypothetical protein